MIYKYQFLRKYIEASIDKYQLIHAKEEFLRTADNENFSCNKNNHFLISLRIYNPSEERILMDETIVEDGTFSFKSLAEQIKPLKLGTYTVEIFVALPSTQREEFQDKVRIEYENLDGPYIVREGLLGPTIVYEQEFII